MERKDYSISRGVEKLTFKRGIEINEKPSNLTVTLTLYHKKKIFKIQTLWNFEQVSFDDTTDTETLKALMELQMEARDFGAKWVGKWREENEDPNQFALEFPQGKLEEAEKMGESA